MGPDSPEQMLPYARELVGAAMASGQFMFADTELKIDMPEVEIQIDRERVADLGLTLQDVSDQLGLLLSGDFVNRFDLDSKSYQVLPLVDPQERGDTESVLDYQIKTASGALVPLRATWDTRNDPLDATDGAFVDVQAMPFVGVKGSQSGARLYADTRGFLSLGEDERFVLAGRAQIGSVSGARATEVPPGLLFYSGGAGTVRGQPYQSLSVDLGAGRRIGGRSFLALSGELRAKMRYGVSVVGFYDVGFVGADSWGAENGDWHSGAGLGLRYDTGIGPIRFDVATALDNGNEGDVELYIGIGQAF